jgi:hypothetical protein
MKHDAIFEVASPEGLNLPPKTIGVLLKAGWLHGEQLIRYDSPVLNFILLLIISPAVVGVVRSSE